MLAAAATGAALLLLAKRRFRSSPSKDLVTAVKIAVERATRAKLVSIVSFALPDFRITPFPLPSLYPSPQHQLKQYPRKFRCVMPSRVKCVWRWLSTRPQFLLTKLDEAANERRKASAKPDPKGPPVDAFAAPAPCVIVVFMNSLWGLYIIIAVGAGFLRFPCIFITGR